MQSVYSTAPVDWATKRWSLKKKKNEQEDKEEKKSINVSLNLIQSLFIPHDQKDIK